MKTAIRWIADSRLPQPSHGIIAEIQPAYASVQKWGSGWWLWPWMLGKSLLFNCQWNWMGNNLSKGSVQLYPCVFFRNVFKSVPVPLSWLSAVRCHVIIISLYPKRSSGFVTIYFICQLWHAFLKKNLEIKWFADIKAFWCLSGASLKYWIGHRFMRPVCTAINWLPKEV